MTVVAGVPVMVGARLAGGVVGAACRLKVNGSSALACPSLTVITMPLVRADVGRGRRARERPVDGVKVSQLGRSGS